MHYNMTLWRVRVTIVVVCVRNHALFIRHANHIFSEILDALNNKKQLVAIFCDLEKASECVNHDILSSKLELYRVRGKINDFMKFYFKTDIRYY